MAMNPRLLVPRAVYDPDAAKYLAAVEAADGQALETPVKRAIDGFVRECKTAGIWDAIKASCILCGARTLSGALVPLKGTAPTNNNFVAADYNRETGLAGDGSTKYLDTNRAVTADPQDNCHLSGFATSVASGGAGILGSAFTTTTGASVLSAVNPIAGRLRNTTFTTGTIDASPPSFAGFSRSGSSGFTAQGNSASEFLSATSAVFGGSGNYTSHRFSTSYYQTRVAFYSIGEAIDLEALGDAVSALVTAIGAAI
jgi:hypothetical protein